MSEDEEKAKIEGFIEGMQHALLAARLHRNKVNDMDYLIATLEVLIAMQESEQED